MTLIRKLALRISEIVVRYASPGCKDWAEGLSREAAVIENDWSALSWALGSVRVLFDRREAPLRSLDNISSATWSFVESKRKAGTAIWLFLFIFAFQTAIRFFMARSSVEYIGYGLIVSGMLGLGISVLIEQRRLNLLRTTDTRTDVLIYKEELRRSLGLPWSPRDWFLWIGVLISFIGVLLARSSGPPTDSVYLILNFFGVAPLIYRKRRTIRRRLERLEVLLAEKS